MKSKISKLKKYIEELVIDIQPALSKNEINSTPIGTEYIEIPVIGIKPPVASNEIKDAPIVTK